MNHTVGLKLKALAEKSKEKIVLKIHFENTKSDRVNVTFYLQASTHAMNLVNRMSYHVVESFYPFYQKISKYINLDVVYDLKTCPYCSEADCYYEKQFCSTDYEHGSSANGRMILDQQLREKVMFSKHLDKWWEYMDCITDECSVVTELEQCSQVCEAKVGQKDFKAEVADSHGTGTNKHFQDSLSQLNNSGVDSFPSVAFNSVKMTGSL